MSEFHRMITYLYLYEQGLKGRNVGFAKIEKRDSRCLVEIHMKNISYSSAPIPVYFYAQKQQTLPGILLGSMGLSHGNGDFKVILNAENLSDSGYSLEYVKGIFIPLSDKLMVVSQWDDDEFVREQFVEFQNDGGKIASSEEIKQQKETDNDSNHAVPHSITGNGSERVVSDSTAGDGSERVVSDSMAGDGSIRAVPTNTAGDGSIRAVPTNTAGDGSIRAVPTSTAGDGSIRAVPTNTAENQSGHASSTPPADITAAEAAPKLIDISRRETRCPHNSVPQNKQEKPEDWNLKWNFILENYPVMTPFAGDENTLCVRFDLKDLRQLPKQHWYLGNNSFLLHGFFNYRYLILGMTEKSASKKWFIGVPGVFQNPERVMAALFGFPEFRNEKSAPINTGEFGYWYRYLN